MSVTYGFYNSVNEDRRYNAEQLSQIFDGIIADGVYQTVGDAFVVKHASGSSVTVGTGRSWFNGTWTLNDTILPITLPKTDVVLNRIDAVVLEINKNVASRKNEIKVVEGVPGSSPKRPSMKKTLDLFQYPLAYIYRKAGTTSIAASDITNAVGTVETPFVVGVVKSMTIDFIVQQWEAQWREWFNKYVDDGEERIDTWFTEKDQEHSTWSLEKRKEFDDWFKDIDELLKTNDAGALAGKLKDLQSKWDLLEDKMTIQHYLLDSEGSNILNSVGGEIKGHIYYEIK